MTTKPELLRQIRIYDNMFNQLVKLTDDKMVYYDNDNDWCEGFDYCARCITYILEETERKLNNED